MAKYPDRRSAAIPALHAAQALHGWCSPEAIEQVAAVMQLTPAYLTSVATLLRHARARAAPRADDVYVCTNISCSLRGADEFFEAMIAAAAPEPDVHVRSFECLGACDIAPMASVNGEYVGPLDPEDAGPDHRRPQSRRPRARAQAAALPPLRGPGRGAGDPTAMKLLFEGIDEPGLNTLPVYEQRGGYEQLKRALQMAPEDVLEQHLRFGSARPRRRRLPDGPEGLVPAPRRHGEVPRLQRG